MDAATAITLFAFAAAVGCYGTIIGAGGGFILVPGLVVLFDFAGVEAVGTSALALAVIGLNGARVYDRDGLVDRPAAASIALTAAPMALLFAWLVADRLDGDLFLVLLGLLLLALAVLVIVGRARGAPESVREARRAPLVIGGTVIGAVAGTFAVGAGLLTVPLMTRVRGLQPHRAAATTAAAGVAGSVAGSVGHSLAGNPVWSKVPAVLFGALLGSSAGARLAGRLSPAAITNLLVAGLIAAAVPLLVEAL